MRFKKYYYIICLCLIINLVSFSQNQKIFNDIPLILIENNHLSSIIDSMIRSEKKCEYYNDKLNFSILIESLNDSTSTITIESNDDSCVMQMLHPIGFLEREGHSIFLYGLFANELYKRTNQTKKFTICMPSFLGYDDSFSQWNYVEKIGILTLINKFSYCQ